MTAFKNYSVFFKVSSYVWNTKLVELCEQFPEYVGHMKASQSESENSVIALMNGRV